MSAVNGSTTILRKLRLSYKNMLSRCYYEKNDSFPHYGGRGISVCEEWRNNRLEFIGWAVAHGHNLGLSLDRIDNNADYSPENCKWSTITEQLRNQRRNVNVSHNGCVRSVAEWCEILELNETQKNTAYKRCSANGASTYDEIFCNNLLAYRHSVRVNKCLVCEREQSVKWRKHGKLCNTCYHRALRWSKSVESNIEDFNEWNGLFSPVTLIERELRPKD